MKKLVVILLSFTVINVFAGDVLTLMNGNKFDGKVVKIKECQIEYKIQNEKFLIPASDIHSIQFEDINNRIYRNYLKSANRDINNCLAGSLDAEMYHGKKFGHFMLGFLFGPFAMVGTALSNPTPEKGKETMLMSRNRDFFSDVVYLKCYKKQAKSQLIGAEALGWCTWILISLNLLYAI